MTDTDKKDGEEGGAREQAAKPEPISIREFLENVGTSQWREIADDLVKRNEYGQFDLITPAVTLPCTNAACNGARTFRYHEGNTRFANSAVLNTFITYRCGNCHAELKRFALQVIRDPRHAMYKYGESPAFGPPTPPRLLRLFGSDKDLFLKGRRAESQGLGIGAFGYYRRVVESHKTQLLEQIIKVAKTVGLPATKIAILEAAVVEIQFSKAIESVKDAIPETLLIKGHNPLTLLHAAISRGLHAKTDQECLELAHDVRVVLVELAEKIGAALNDDNELTNSVNRLMQSQAKK